jgi:hypothetical protein
MEAERYLLRSEKNIIEQRQILSDLERDGHDTSIAKNMLDSLLISHEIHAAEADQIRRQLADHDER